MPVRNVVFTTFAILAGLAVALVYGDRGPILPTAADLLIHSGVILIGTFTASVAILLLMAGAAHARTWFRFLLVVPILVAIGMIDLAKLPIIVRLLPVPFAIGILVLVWAAPRLKLWATLSASLAIVVAYAATVTAVTWWLPKYGPSVFTAVMAIASYATVPALLVTGFDLAEIGAGGTSKLWRFLLARLRAAAILKPLVPALGALAVYSVIFLEHHAMRDVSLIALWSVLIALAMAVSLAVMRSRPSAEAVQPVELGYLQVLGMAIAFAAGALLFPYYTVPNPDYLTYDGVRPFSMQAPPMAETSRALPQSDASKWTRVDFGSNRNLPALSVVAVPQEAVTGPVAQPDDLRDVADVKAPFPIPILLGKRSDKGWHDGDGPVTDALGRKLHYFVARREDNSNMKQPADWYIVCSDLETRTEKLWDICRAAVTSFSVAPAGGQQSSRLLAMALCGLFAAAAIATLLGATRRQGRGILEFAAWALLLTALRWSAGFVFGGIDDPLLHPQMGADLLAAQVGVSVIAAAGAALWPGGRQWRILGQAAGTAVILTMIYYAYVFAALSERYRVLQSFVVLFLLTWELWTAGANLNPTNEHHVFPRASRVLIFAGYLILVASCVFVFNDPQLADAETISSFPADTMVADGLVVLGGALVMSRTMRALADRSRPSREIRAREIREGENHETMPSRIGGFGLDDNTGAGAGA